MQNKGIVKFIAVALILVCCFYLSFSFVTRHYESKAEALRAELGDKAAEEYLDSISSEDHIWLGAWSPGVWTTAVRWRLAWVLT